jgi:hypothetical protein
MNLFNDQASKSQSEIEQELINNYTAIKAQGFVQSRRTHNTGIGKTFEDLAGIAENNLAAPDYGHVEVKSHRHLSGSYITLFTQKPDNPIHANTFIREEYGYKDATHNLKTIHTSFFATKYNSCRGIYGFKLIPNDLKQQLHISVKDLKTDSIINEDIYFHYDTLRHKVNLKTSHLALIGADSRRGESGEEFHFKRLKLLRGKGFERFMELLKGGNIRFDIRIGFFKTGPSFGKTHDHGSGFRISKPAIPMLFDMVYDD